MAEVQAESALALLAQGQGLPSSWLFPQGQVLVLLF
jgi:hypothetical protein